MLTNVAAKGRVYIPVFAYVAVCLLATTVASHANDISTYFGNNGMTGFFGTFLKWLEGPIAQAVCVMVVVGAIWRLRNNFEWGEAGTTVMLIILAVGSLALIGSLWAHLQGSGGGNNAQGWGSTSGMLF